MKPLDFVKTPGGGIALISETHDNGKEAMIKYIYNPKNEHMAWWKEKELEVLISLSKFLASMTYQSFGRGAEDVNKFFKE